jgi:hypothetical protein
MIPYVSSAEQSSWQGSVSNAAVLRNRVVFGVCAFSRALPLSCHVAGSFKKRINADALSMFS